jgi:exodeoxyribonuclease V alpha subunit
MIIIKNKNTISFRYIPIKQNYPKTFSINVFDDFKEDVEDNSEITFRIYAGESRDENVKQNSYYNISIVGNLPELAIGVEYDVIAIEEEKNNEPQYKVVSIKRKKPLTNEAIRMFLLEILTPVQTEQIMLHYPNIIDIVSEGKTDTIDVTKLHGIGNYIIKVIERKILENFKFAEIIAEFEGLLNFEILKKLSEKYTSIEEIKNEIRNNPYDCLTDLNRVGFKIADKTIINFNRDCKKKLDKGETPPITFDYDILTSKQRAYACVDYILNENENNGHTKILSEDLIKTVRDLAPECFSHVITVLKDKNKYILKNPYVTKKKTFETELYIAMILKYALLPENNVKWNIDNSKYQKEFNLTDEQFSILENVCNNNVCVLNGAGGTGKSFTIKAILQMLKDNNIENYLLASPTGKAAKVIKAYTGEEARTVHRMLGAKGDNIFEFDEKHKLDTDIIFIDEFSMMDIFLTKHLFEAIDFTRTKLILIGDSAQLPSVSCGNVFHDILQSSIPKTTLTKVFRYGVGGISTVATNTRLRKETITKENDKQVILGEDKAYVYFNIAQDKVVKSVLTLYKKLLETNPPENISVLTSYNKGDYGTISLNNYLQAIANPKAKNKQEPFIKVIDTKFYINDIVMQNVNNYKAVIFVESIEESLRQNNQTFISNGDVGKIIDIDFQKQVALIKFDDSIVVYTVKQLYNCRLSYIYTIHKSQGSQNNIIILLTPKAHTYMLNSNLIYVGVTRATNRVYHFGELETFNRAVKIKANFDRLTFLQDLLINK